VDTYRTIKAASEGAYSEKRSKFLAFAIPVRSVEDVKQIVAEYQKK
jgi:putative IMPACT (imprinted ancient) family translation regulator